MKRWEREVAGADGGKLFCQAWLPASGEWRGAVLAVHGVGDHGGGLARLTEGLVARGYGVFAPDLRGHGRSPGAQGHVRRWEEFRQDLFLLREFAAREAAGRPLFLLGHSLGGAVVLDSALQRPDGLAGVVAIAPAVAVEMSGGMRLALKVLGAVVPGLTIKGRADLTKLTRDPEVLRSLSEDGLRHAMLSTGLGRATLEAGAAIMAGAGQLRVPICLAYGTADPLTPPAALRAFYDAVSTPDKQRFEYEGMLHRPFDEIGREQVVADLAGWCQRHADAVNALAGANR